jgi:hypothetical protein
MDIQASHPTAESDSSPKFLQQQSEQRGLAPAEQEVVAALNAAGRDAPGRNERIPNRPTIVFADADQPDKKRKSFFKSNDLD